MKKAFLFPGQGSQFAGMGKSLAEQFPAAARCFEEADDTLGFSLSKICFEGPDEVLRQTEFQQPALLAVSIAAFRVLSGEIGEPIMWPGTAWVNLRLSLPPDRSTSPPRCAS